MFVQKLVIVLVPESKKYLQLEVWTSGQVQEEIHEHFDMYNFHIKLGTYQLFYSTNRSSIIKAIICCSVEFSAIMGDAYDLTVRLLE